MANTTARQIIFVILIFSAIITGGFSLIAISAPTTNINDDFNLKYNSTLNKFNEIQTKTDTITSAMRSNSNYGTIEKITTAGWGILTLIWSGLDTFSTVIYEIPYALGLAIPGWFFALILAFLFITVVFAFLAAIFHWFLWCKKIVDSLTGLTNGTQGFHHFAQYSNDVTNGLFWGLILIAIFTIIIVKQRNYGIERAIGNASFSCLSISLFLFFLQFVQIVYPVIFVIILAGTLAYIMFIGD